MTQEPRFKVVPVPFDPKHPGNWTVIDTKTGRDHIRRQIYRSDAQVSADYFNKLFSGTPELRTADAIRVDEDIPGKPDYLIDAGTGETFGIPIRVDNSLPPGTIQLQDSSTGEIHGEITFTSEEN